ncbi:hypothetical protein PSEUDO8O_170001 [Pseudomonas sp. 8O]|nr:hypothetical protein PSEUDO8O_170001 [Pseudomonas sp. 8O]
MPGRLVFSIKRKKPIDNTLSLSRMAAAGWSSLVARRAHNPKVVGSNPAPATTFRKGHSNEWPFCLPGRLVFSIKRKKPIDNTLSLSRMAAAGWSSLVARRAHNPKVVGSNPAPATTFR